MIKFLNKKTGNIETAFSAKKDGDKIYIKFTKNSKEYIYNEETIEFLKAEERKESKSPFIIYTFKKQCYKCKRYTDIYTYIIFDDGSNESLKYPWNKKRLLENQDIFAHIEDPSIEYYGFKVVGDFKKYDDILMKIFKGKIEIRHSSVTKTSYPMNLCSHCGAPQGNYYVYRQINEMITNMQKIDVVD